MTHPSPCAFCGFPDQRHRVVDAIEERIEAGESADWVLSDYGYSLEEFEALRAEVYPDGS